MLWLDNLLPSFPAKWTQKLHTDDMSLAKIWQVLLIGVMQIFLEPWPIRSTTQIWVVMHHQYGVSAPFPQVSFYGETSTGIAKCWLIYQPNQRAKCLQYFDFLNFLISVTSFLAPQTTSNSMLARAFKSKLLSYFIDSFFIGASPQASSSLTCLWIALGVLLLFRCLFVTSNCAKFLRLWYVQTVLSCFCMAGCKLANKDPNHKELDIVRLCRSRLSHNY